MNTPLTYIGTLKVYSNYTRVKIKQDDSTWSIGLAYSDKDGEVFVRDCAKLNSSFIMGDVEPVSFEALSEKDVVVGYGRKGVYSKIDSSTGLNADDLKDIHPTLPKGTKYLRVTSSVFVSNFSEDVVNACIFSNVRSLTC